MKLNNVTEPPVQITSLNYVEVRKRIDALDLSAVIFKLTLSPDCDGCGWNGEYAAEIARMYRNFLFLKVTTVGGRIIPLKAIDIFWHTHILDTFAYARDCALCFGFFLHHFPYLGLRGREDALKLREFSLQTAQLYQEQFGEIYMEEAPVASMPKPADERQADGYSDGFPGCG